VSRREKYLVERIDRGREHAGSQQARSSRATFLRMTARRTVRSLMQDVTDPKEQAALLGDLIDIAAEFRWPLIGRVETATALNSVAADVCAIYRLPKAVKNAAAEHAWSRLTAANDGGEE
jgi:hypothetical protein